MTKTQRVKRLIFGKKIFKVALSAVGKGSFSDKIVVFVCNSNHRHGMFGTRQSHETIFSFCVIAAPKSGPQINVWNAIGFQSLAPLKLINKSLNAKGYPIQLLYKL